MAEVWQDAVAFPGIDKHCVAIPYYVEHIFYSVKHVLYANHSMLLVNKIGVFYLGLLVMIIFIIF